MESRDRDQLRAICAEVFGVDLDEIEADTDFADDLNAERDDLADILVAVEEAFGISLDHGLRRIRTFDDLEELVEDEIG